MESGKKDLKELFTGDRYFYIPDYQRSYAWEDKQLYDFFEDFKSNYNGCNKRYYYGTILLQSKEDESKEKYDIVDGQQRLTTLIIFIKCLIKRLLSISNRGDDFDDREIEKIKDRFIACKKMYILTLQQDDNDFFHTYILEDNVYSDDFRTPSQKKLFHAKDEFNKLLENTSDDVVLSFMDKINSTNVLVYKVNSRSEASLIFETTNDRGKQLTNIEKTKSYLMYKASLLDDSEQLLGIIQSRFNIIYQDYAFFENKQISEDSILQYTFIAHENWNNSKTQKEYQHYMEFMKEKSEVLTEQKKYNEFIEYVDKYTLNIMESFSIMKKMFTLDYEEFKDLQTLGVMYNFYPLLIKSFKFDISDEKIDFKKVCRLLEIFVFRVYIIRKYLTNKFQTKWFEIARNFDGNFASLCNSIISLIKVNEFGGDEAFLADLQSKNFFDSYKPLIKNYFFWKYENYLRSTQQPISSKMPHEDLKRDKDNKTKLSIEHIVARKNIDEHSRVISDEKIISVGKRNDISTFSKEYLNAIGNLTLDPQSANSSKGKKDVEEKISKYFNKAPYKCQNELEDFMVDGKWKIESINKRTDALIKFAKDTWCNYDQFYTESEKIETIESDDDDEIMIQMME